MLRLIALTLVAALRSLVALAVPVRGSQTSGGRWYRPPEKKPGADLASAQHLATFQSAVFNIEDAFEIDAEFTLSGLAGGASPSYQLQLQTCQDPTNPIWITRPENPPALTANGFQRVTYSAPGVAARWNVIVTGGPTGGNVAIDTQAIVGAV